MKINRRRVKRITLASQLTVPALFEEYLMKILGNTIEQEGSKKHAFLRKRLKIWDHWALKNQSMYFWAKQTISSLERENLHAYIPGNLHQKCFCSIWVHVEMNWTSGVKSFHSKSLELNFLHFVLNSLWCLGESIHWVYVMRIFDRIKWSKLECPTISP